MEKLWTTQEVAKFLGIEDVDVEHLVREGKLTGYKLGGQFLRFQPAQVKALQGTLRLRRTGARRAAAVAGEPWYARLRDTFYFYDFYVVSATLLAALLVYLLVSS
ncbi:MAG: helix-turn-helix domain-containing protein [Candidatus Omnitrophica bacterium]|nr:helix-turn-helix domain-containing protein [Candidatus Omnitrophota bacterium]